MVKRLPAVTTVAINVNVTVQKMFQSEEKSIKQAHRSLHVNTNINFCMELKLMLPCKSVR